MEFGAERSWRRVGYNRGLGVLLRAAVLLLAFATTHFNAALRSHPCARGAEPRRPLRRSIGRPRAETAGGRDGRTTVAHQ
jgi:hypothetical protein